MNKLAAQELNSCTTIISANTYKPGDITNKTRLKYDTYEYVQNTEQ